MITGPRPACPIRLSAAQRREGQNTLQPLSRISLTPPTSSITVTGRSNLQFLNQPTQFSADPGAQISDGSSCPVDPARNDIVTEHVLCSLCRHILTDSAILNPSKRKDDEHKVEKPELCQKHMLEHDKACTVERYRHRQTIQDIGASGDAGCHLCALIWHNWEIRLEISLFNDPELIQRQQQFCIYITRRPCQDGSDVVELYVNPFVDDNGRDKFDCSVVAMQNDRHTAKLSQVMGSRHAAPTMVPGNDDANIDTDTPRPALDGAVLRDLQLARIAKSTASEYTLALVRFWLQSCLSDHNTLCASPSPFPESGFLPTRLVDLGYAPDTIRVVTTAGLDLRQTAYLTLSHCWGGAAVLALTAATADSLRAGVPISALPKTFSDAARVVLGLGYRYLWIDSLCIQQDSASDWALESRSMDLVYRRSVLTLAALAARSSHDGLFIRRNPLCYRSCDLTGVTEYPLKMEGRHFRRVTVRRDEERGKASYLANTHGDDGRTGSSLLRLRRRGWVFQEDLLARRTLYFGPDGVYWECLESKLDEAHDAGNKGGTCVWCARDGSWTLKYQFHRLEALLRDGAGRTSEESAYNFEEFHLRWWGILEAYSASGLTQLGDKLVAVYGLVKAIEASSGGRLTNVAGHWRQNLPFDLLWATGDGSYRAQPNTCTRSSEYRAPSWSWAAVDGPVRFIWVFNRLFGGFGAERGFDFTIQPDAEVLDVALVPKYEGNRFNGQLCGGHITLSGRTRPSTWGEMDEAHFNLNGRPRLRGQGYCDWVRDDHRETNYTEVRCILLARMRQDMGNRIIYQDSGLALVPHPTSPGSWMRVGVFSQDYYESEKTAPSVFFSNCRNSARETVRIV